MEEQDRKKVSVFEDDEIPYEVRMKHLIEGYRRDLKRLDQLARYTKGLEEENITLQKQIAKNELWFSIDTTREMAFDHDEIMKDAMSALYKL